MDEKRFEELNLVSSFYSVKTFDDVKESSGIMKIESKT